MNYFRRLLSNNSIRLFSTSIINKQPPLVSNIFSSVSSTQQSINNAFLVPKVPILVQTCGLKIKGKMRLRCKDCYYVRRDGRLYVMCKSFPRHKQTHLATREKYTWIFSHAMQSKSRPY